MPQTHPVLSCAEAARWEDSLLGSDEAKIWAAMTLAGEAVANAALRDFLEIRPLPLDAFRVLVLCGTGHNAGDALVAARKILATLPQATALAVLAYGREKLRPLALRALDEFNKAGGSRASVETWNAALAQSLQSQPFNLCIEGVVGTQMRPPLRPPAPELFALTARMDIEMRAAVDLPAGLADECAPDGFTADFTYATGIAKAPVLDAANVARTGRVRCLDIGLFDQSRPGTATGREILLPSTLHPLRGLRPSASDKRSYGHVFLLGGSRTMPGALAMATMASVRAGAGLTTALVPSNLSTRLAPLAPEAMWVPMPIDAEGAPDPEESLRIIRRVTEKASVLVIGPGMDVTSRETRAMLSRLIRETNLPLVIDASAISADSVAAADSRPASAPPVVFTPHMGEFARMAGASVLEPGCDIDTRLREFAARTRCIVILKGPVTRICDGSRVICDTFGGPVLARGGSGDLLAGILGALLARRGADGLECACQAALWHGLAAEHLARERGQQGVRTIELLDHLSPALREA